MPAKRFFLSDGQRHAMQPLFAEFDRIAKTVEEYPDHNLSVILKAQEWKALMNSFRYRYDDVSGLFKKKDTESKAYHEPQKDNYSTDFLSHF